MITEFEVPFGLEGGQGIAAGPDGNLWFTGYNSIGRITTAGVAAAFPHPTATGGLGGIAAGIDGNLWFTEASPAFGVAGAIGRITTGPTGPCVANDTTLCLSASRFQVTADFETLDGRNGAAHAVPLTGNTGYFWFFDPTNVEVVTKVLPFCADPFNSIWIFAAGLTNVKVDLTYSDMNNGTVVTKSNELGVPFTPIQDTSAFTTCP